MAFLSKKVVYTSHYQYSPSPNSRGLIKKRGLAIFPEEINGEGVNKWKWVNFVMQCLNRGVVNSWGDTKIL